MRKKRWYEITIPRGSRQQNTITLRLGNGATIWLWVHDYNDQKKLVIRTDQNNFDQITVEQWRGK